MTVRAYAAHGPGEAFKPFEFEPGELGADELDIAVEACGICHTDFSVWRNELRTTQYPFVGGHEIVGRVVATGSNVRHRKEGDRVGLGWFSGSCMGCASCLAGDHNLCSNREDTIMGRFGGFAERVRCHWAWAIPLPERIKTLTGGPLFCAGITVFNPIVQLGIKPTDRVGVVGIGGLGHMALQFLDHWGCEVSAFTSTPAKAAEARQFGADHVVSTHAPEELGAIAGKLDIILVTTHCALKWPLYLEALAPRGRLHIVGGILKRIPVSVYSLLPGQKAISASPLGSPATMLSMVDFCARHGIEPQIEQYPTSQINEAMAHLESGKARYRIVLKADF